MRLSCELGSQPGVTLTFVNGAELKQPALKVHDKIFAMVSSKGLLVVKLPKRRVDLLANGDGWQRFDVKGWPSNEWLEVHSTSSSEWLKLAREALDFVGT